MIRRRFKADLADRLFYALIPMVAYLMLTAAAAMLFRESAAGADLFAAALVTLLAAGVRNAWDITMFIAIRLPANGAPTP